MAVTAATSGFGTTLGRGDGASPEAFTTIAELLDIDGPEFESGDTEATNNDSPNNAAEYVATKVVQAGLVSAKIQYLLSNTTHKQILTDIYACTFRNYKLTSPQASTPFYTIKAMAKRFKPGFPVQDKITADIAFRITEKPTLPT